MTDSKFREEFLSAVDNRKGDIADVVGMPDEKDYETLSRIINRYEKTHPGEIQYVLSRARREFEAGQYGKNMLWKGDAKVISGMTYAFELPPDLYRAIEQVFPSMFKSKKHLRWFKKNFYKLTIANQ